jgi:hypothetical protein
VYRFIHIGTLGLNGQWRRANPERFATQALGHSSKAVHRAYSRKAQMKLVS